MTIKERLVKFAKSKERSVRAFEREAGLTIGYVNTIRVSVQPDKLQRIASRYPDLNTEWLMTGVGPMTRGGSVTVSYTHLPDGICEKIAVVPFGAYHVDVDAHVVQLRDSCVVYPPDVLRNLAADVACVIKHHFREYHPVEWFVMFEGKENCCDTILAKRTRGYVSRLGHHFR